MASPLDDISYRLGEVSAGQAMLLKRAEKRDAEQAAIKDMLTAISAKLDPVVEDTEWMKPHVKSYAAVRGRAAWVGTLIVGVAGIFGGTFGNWLLKKYGG